LWPGTPMRVASVGTQSLLALKSFLQGEQFFRRAVWDSAIEHFQRAATLDTTFALAIRRLGTTRSWLGTGEATSYWLRAGRFNHGLSPRDSILVSADSAAAAYWDTLDPGYWTRLLTRTSTLEEGTRRYPDDPEMWYQLGEARFHDGIAVGTTPQQILSTFDRAIALDSSFGPAYVHAISLALDSAGPLGAKPYIDGYLSSTSQVEEGEGVRFIPSLLSYGGNADLSALADTVPPNILLGAFDHLASWTDSSDLTARLARLLRQRQIPAKFDTLYYAEALASALEYRGHLHEARAAVGNRFHYLFAELALLGVVPRDTADAVVARWFQNVDDRALQFSPQGDRCHWSLGAMLWWASRRDTIRLRELVRRATRTVAAPPNVYQLGLAQADVGLGRTGLALAAGDTAEASRRIMALPDSLCPRFLPLRLVRFQLLADARRDAEAAALFDHTPATDPAVGFSAGLGMAKLTRARLAERLQDKATAIQYYQRVLDTWPHADPELRPYVQEAKAGLDRLRGELRQ
jgi:eukaryotic-like serine/threonine-protein kinase